MGDRIREARERAGLSVYELSKKTGLTQVHLGRYETGRSTPRSSHLILLSEALGVSVECFLRPPEDEWPGTPR